MNGLDIFGLSWTLASIAVFFACFIRGITGFGQSLLLAPILLLIINPKSVVMTNMILGTLGSLVLLPYVFKNLNMGKLLPLVIGSLVGIPIGVSIIKVIDQAALKVLIGTLTVGFAIPIALGLGVTFKKEKMAAGICGLLSGTIGTSTSLGGPPVVLFMHSQNWSKVLSYSTITTAFILNGLLSLSAFFFSGLLTGEIAIGAASLVPALVAGLWTGRLVFPRVNIRLFRLFSIAIIIVSGVLGVLSGLGIL